VFELLTLWMDGKASQSGHLIIADHIHSVSQIVQFDCSDSTNFCPVNNPNQKNT